MSWGRGAKDMPVARSVSASQIARQPEEGGCGVTTPEGDYTVNLQQRPHTLDRYNQKPTKIDLYKFHYLVK